MANRYYVGSCLSLDERVQEHWSKKYLDSFTAKYDDWILFFAINDLEYNQARRIESHVKRMKSKKFIENLRMHREIVQKLTEKYK